MGRRVKKDIKIEYRKTIGVLVISFILLGFLVNGTNLIQQIDYTILTKIVESDNNILLLLSKNMEWFGSALGYLLIGMILMAYCIRKRIYKDIKLYTATAITVGATNQLLKLYYDRERPLEFFRVDKSGKSFPSGHAMGVVAMYVIIVYIVARRFPQHKIKVQLVSALIIAVMGLSRLYLGVHWPSDIVAGYIGGAVVALVMINVEKRDYKLRAE